jgi:hypothetical protein
MEKTTEKAGAKGAAAAAGGSPAPQQGIPADLLKQASVLPTNLKVEEFNPMENIPTLAVGEEFKAGMTVAGWFEETQLIASPKFKFSQERNEKGVPVQRRHVLRIGSPTGPRLGIWTTGELTNTFEKLQPLTFIAITYKGKGMNSNNQQQHFFEYKRELAQ